MIAFVQIILCYLWTTLLRLYSNLLCAVTMHTSIHRNVSATSCVDVAEI